MKVEIEYCVQWNYRPEADRVSAEISELENVTVELIDGKGGIFEVRRDGELLWKKERGGAFPTEGEITAAISSW